MVIAVDTSIWADYFSGALPHVRELMVTGQIVQSPTVTGELAMGNLRNRARTIAALQALDPLALPSDDAVHDFVNVHALFGTGIGWSDAQILASVVLGGDCYLWTRDKRLCAQSERLGVAYDVLD